MIFWFNIIYFVLVASDMGKCIVTRFQNMTSTLLYYLQKTGTETHVPNLSLYRKAHCKYKHDFISLAILLCIIKKRIYLSSDDFVQMIANTLRDNPWIDHEAWQYHYWCTYYNLYGFQIQT